MGRPRRQFTTQEIAIAQLYARDPNRTKDDLCKVIKCSKDLLPSLLRAADLDDDDWIRNTRSLYQKRQFTEEEKQIATRFANDPASTLQGALKALNTSYRTFHTLLAELGVEWVNRNFEGYRRNRTKTALHPGQIFLNDDQQAQLHQLAADPKVTKAQAARDMGFPESTFYNLLSRYSVTWVTPTREQRMTKAPAQKVDMDLLRKLAEDSSVSFSQAAKTLGCSKSTLYRIAQIHSIEWVYEPKAYTYTPKKRSETRDFRTNPESIDLTILSKLAADPSVCKAEAARYLSCAESTLYKTLRKNPVEWVYDTKYNKPRKPKATKSAIKTKPRKTYPPCDIGDLQRLAADPTVSMVKACKVLNIPNSRLQQLISRHKIEWARCRTGKPPKINKENQVQIHIRTPTKLKRKPTPKVPIPEYQMFPEEKRGMQGFTWQCDYVGASGWKAGNDKKEVEEEVRKDIAFIVSRHSKYLGKKLGRSMEI